MIEIKCTGGNIINVDEFWLRDHCRCQGCYNAVTRQRKYNLLDLPDTIKPEQQQYSKDGRIYEVVWNDGHCSKYDINFIYNSQIKQLIGRTNHKTPRTPWNASVLPNLQKKLRVTLTDLIRSESASKQLLQSLIQYGMAFIDEVPPNATMTEMAIRSVFPIMKTFFGEMYTFSDTQLDHADTAYTKEYLDCHTDNTYFCDAAGLQALHCIKHNGSGGENFFVDGLNAALQLKEQNPEAYELLCTVQVPAEYIEDGEYHKHSAEIIRIDSITKEIVQLRLNVYDRAAFNTLPQHQMQKFYGALREFLKIVHKPENTFQFKLSPGTILIFDNWRVFHGRQGYTGARVMTGCYVQRTDFMSKARVLGIID